MYIWALCSFVWVISVRVVSLYYLLGLRPILIVSSVRQYFSFQKLNTISTQLTRFIDTAQHARYCGQSSWLIHQHKDEWKMSWQCWSWPSMGRLYSSEKEKHRKNRESCPSQVTHLAKTCEGQLLPPENNMVGHGSYNLVQGSHSEWLSILARWYRVIADKMSRKATRISSTTKRFDAIDNVDLLEARL